MTRSPIRRRFSALSPAEFNLKEAHGVLSFKSFAMEEDIVERDMEKLKETNEFLKSSVTFWKDKAERCAAELEVVKVDRENLHQLCNSLTKHEQEHEELLELANMVPQLKKEKEEMNRRLVQLDWVVAEQAELLEARTSTMRVPPTEISESPRDDVKWESESSGTSKYSSLTAPQDIAPLESTRQVSYSKIQGGDESTLLLGGSNVDVQEIDQYAKLNDRIRIQELLQEHSRKTKEKNELVSENEDLVREIRTLQSLDRPLTQMMAPPPPALPPVYKKGRRYEIDSWRWPGPPVHPVGGGDALITPLKKLSSESEVENISRALRDLHMEQDDHDASVSSSPFPLAHDGRVGMVDLLSGSARSEEDGKSVTLKLRKQIRTLQRRLTATEESYAKLRTVYTMSLEKAPMMLEAAGLGSTNEQKAYVDSVARLGDAATRPVHQRSRSDTSSQWAGSEASEILFEEIEGVENELDKVKFQLMRTKEVLKRLQ
eukprot:Filipodium_phascolosomae@DN3468_c0_g1_i1.p1